MLFAVPHPGLAAPASSPCWRRVKDPRRGEQPRFGGFTERGRSVRRRNTAPVSASSGSWNGRDVDQESVVSGCGSGAAGGRGCNPSKIAARRSVRPSSGFFPLSFVYFSLRSCLLASRRHTARRRQPRFLCPPPRCRPRRGQRVGWGGMPEGPERFAGTPQRLSPPGAASRAGMSPRLPEPACREVFFPPGSSLAARRGARPAGQRLFLFCARAPGEPRRRAPFTALPFLDRNCHFFLLFFSNTASLLLARSLSPPRAPASGRFCDARGGILCSRLFSAVLNAGQPRRASERARGVRTCARAGLPARGTIEEPRGTRRTLASSLWMGWEKKRMGRGVFYFMAL